MTLIYDVIVIGGGAAGMMAAITAGAQGAKVLLLERNPKVGRKIYITGKGRCNVTNHCDTKVFLENLCCNAKFLHSGISQFPPEATEEFFTSRGVPLKVERGNRVFPESDKATDIIDCLLRELRKSKVFIREDRALEVEKDDLFTVFGEESKYQGKKLILATGGVSYPKTGSTGDGYHFAESLGHSIVPLYPSLIPLEIKESFCKDLQGLSLKNVGFKVKNSKKKTIFSQQGELLFTHFGISGPLVLSASTHMRAWDQEHYTCYIDFKPALTEEQLDERLLRELTEHANRDILNILPNLLPRLMVPVMANYVQIAHHRKGHEVRKAERLRLLEALKSFRLTVEQPRPLEEAVVTAGGVSVKEVNPKTMESKKVEGLFLAGELLDLDAYTGGFNLQIAWSTGFLAGKSASEREDIKND
ncbi:MAG: NAD(P)/FAD-dependent oxidoreductase [Eubacteriales bacterium]